MGLFVFIIAAALLPAAFTAAGYFISFRRMPDDHEIRARKRWKLASRGNAVFLVSVIGGLIAVTEGGRDLPAVAKILISYLFILITFTPFMIALGEIDRRVREVEFPLRGYVTFQYFFFFGRWSSILVIVAFLLIPVRLTGPDGGVSFMGTGRSYPRPRTTGRPMTSSGSPIKPALRVRRYCSWRPSGIPSTMPLPPPGKSSISRGRFWAP
jgi:hypothetical protein